MGECNGEVTVSANLLELLDHVADLELDIQAISVFLHLGFFLADKTPFRHIRAVLPGETGTLDEAGLRWDRGRDVAPAQSELGLAEVTDAFVHGMRRAVAAAGTPSQPFVHPLSGGRDSRYLLFELLKQGHTPRECVTLAESIRHPDAVTAGQVAASLGIPHRVLRPSGQGFDHEIINVDATHLCADEHGWLVPLAAELRRITPVVFDGLGGGVLFRSPFAADATLASEEQMAARVVDRYRAPDPEALLTAGALLGCQLSVRAEVEEVIAQALKSLAGEPNPLQRFIFLNRTRREIALVPRSMYRGIPSVHTPFLHPEVLGLARCLPSRFFAEHRDFQDHAIRVAFPEVELPYVGRNAVSPPRRLRASRAISSLRRSLWWRRHLDTQDRALARKLTATLKRNRLIWLLMLKSLVSSRAARHEVIARAEQALGPVRIDAVDPGAMSRGDALIGLRPRAGDDPAGVAR